MPSRRLSLALCLGFTLAIGLTPQAEALGGWGCGGGSYYGGSYYGGSYNGAWMYYGTRPMTYYPPPPLYAQPAYGPPYSSTPAYGQPYSQPYSSAPGYGRPRAASSSPARPTTIVSVAMYDNRFEPQTISVQPGTTVRWTNAGTHNHTVTAQNQSWDSGDIAPGATYSATFQRPGTYHFYCRHHDGMQGSIVVGRGDSARSPAAQGAARPSATPAGGNATRGSRY
jgi:plastocyanin